jgi:hypothetical protein
MPTSRSVPVHTQEGSHGDSGDFDYDLGEACLLNSADHDSFRSPEVQACSGSTRRNLNSWNWNAIK